MDIVSAGYLAALGARIDRGRDIAPTDREETLPVCVVNEAFVKHMEW